MINPHSQEFSEVRRVCEDRVDVYRSALEKKGLSIEETEYYRGVIWAFREIINLGRVNPVAATKKFDSPARLGDRSGVM